MTSQVDSQKPARRLHRVLDSFLDLDSSDENFDFEQEELTMMNNSDNNGRQPNRGQHDQNFIVANNKNNNNVIHTENNHNNSLSGINNNIVNGYSALPNASAQRLIDLRRRDRELLRGTKKPAKLPLYPVKVDQLATHPSTDAVSSLNSVAVSPSSTNVPAQLKTLTDDDRSSTALLAEEIDNSLKLEKAKENVAKKRKADSPVTEINKRHQIGVDPLSRSSFLVDLTASDDEAEADTESGAPSVPEFLPPLSNYSKKLTLESEEPSKPVQRSLIAPSGVLSQVPGKKTFYEGHEVIDLSDDSDYGGDRESAAAMSQADQYFKQLHKLKMETNGQSGMSGNDNHNNNNSNDNNKDNTTSNIINNNNIHNINNDSITTNNSNYSNNNVKNEPNVANNEDDFEEVDDDDDDDDDDIQIVAAYEKPKPETQASSGVREALKSMLANAQTKVSDALASHNAGAQNLLSLRNAMKQLTANIAIANREVARTAGSSNSVDKIDHIRYKGDIARYSREHVALASQIYQAEVKVKSLREIFDSAKLTFSRLVTANQRQSVEAAEQIYHNEFRSGYESNVYTDHKSLGTLLNNIKPDETYVEGRANTPKELAISLLEHQRIGLAWLQDMEKSESTKGGILADDMGLGKTIQLLALILASASQSSDRKTTLIVAPVALLRQWQQEIATKVKEEYSLTTFIYHQEKLESFQALKEFDVILISYSTLASEFKQHYREAIAEAKLGKNSSVLPARGSGGRYYKSPFFTQDAYFYRVILDEAQWIKNKLTQAAKSVTMLQSEYRWCLSGTPMQNSIEELYSLIRFLKIKPYNNEATFKADISLPIKNASSDKYDDFDTSRAMRKLRALLKAILLRRTKQSQVDGRPILELPEKTVTVEDVHMFDEEKAFYSALEQKSATQADRLMKAAKNNPKGNHNYYSSILVLLLRLRQACCHRYLVEIGSRKNADIKPVRTAVIRKLNNDVVSKINEDADNGFTCPKCFDSVANENCSLLYPCGHAICSDCVEEFFEDNEIGGAGNNEESDITTATCLVCAAKVKESGVIPWEAFDRIWNKGETDQQVHDAMSFSFDGMKRSDRRRQILKLIEEDDGVFKSSAKIDLCISKIEQILQNDPNEKVIVFSQFTSLFEVMKIVLDEKQIQYLQYDGSMNSEDRNATITEFYRDPEKRIFLASLKAGNVGLTLTCANHVIIMDPFWNPYVEEQAADRAHRIGQQRPVFVHRLLIQDTVEDRILTLQRQKQEVINGALDDKGMATISRLSHNEIRFLFGLPT